MGGAGAEPRVGEGRMHERCRARGSGCGAGGTCDAEGWDSEATSHARLGCKHSSIPDRCYAACWCDTGTRLTSNAPLGHINGVGGRTNVTAMLGARLHLDGGVCIVLKAPFARASQGAGAAAQEILSTGKLYDDMGIITMLGPKPHLRMPAPSHTRVPLIRSGRHYMLEASIGFLGTRRTSYRFLPG